jgi:hypothetical protein
MSDWKDNPLGFVPPGPVEVQRYVVIEHGEVVQSGFVPKHIWDFVKEKHPEYVPVDKEGIEPGAVTSEGKFFNLTAKDKEALFKLNAARNAAEAENEERGRPKRPSPEEYLDAAYAKEMGDPAPMQAWLKKMETHRAAVQQSKDRNPNQ